MQYLDSLAQEAVADPGLLREVASAYERLGDVPGKPLNASLGDSAGALQSYSKSLALLQKLSQNGKGYADDAIRLAKIHRAIANADLESGDIGGALEHAKKAVAVATSVLDSAMRNNQSAASELGWDYMTLGNIESGVYSSSTGLSDPSAALNHFEKALAIASQLLKNDPGSVALAHQNALLYQHIGGLQGLMMGRRSEGVENLSVALNTFRSLAARSNNAGFQRGVGAISSVIGAVLIMDGRFQSALTNFRQELAIFKSLSERDVQDIQARADLAEGLASIRRAIALDKQLIAFDPKHGAFRGGLAQHGVMEAETLIRTGDAAGALERYKEALSFYSGLARLDEHNLDARLNVAATDVKIAATLLRLGRVDEAHETYQRALQVMEPAASSNALNQNQQAQYTLADAYSGLGDVALYLARRIKYPIKQIYYRREAISWYEKSLTIWQAIPNRAVISSAGFDLGDPAQVANHLAVCKAALEKLKPSPFVTTESKALRSPNL